MYLDAFCCFAVLAAFLQIEVNGVRARHHNAYKLPMNSIYVLLLNATAHGKLVG
jgi:hypothetical protein